MDSVIFGRTIKNEYLTLGTLGTVAATVFALKGGKKDAVAASRPLAERVNDAVPIKANSRYVVLVTGHAHRTDGHAVRRKTCKFSCLHCTNCCVRCPLTCRMNSIKNFIAEAEKESGGSSHH